MLKKTASERVILSYKKNDRAYRRLKKDIKSKSECSVCGESNPLLLEFDHINRDEKIKQNFRHQSVKRLTIEIEKCRVLCIWCHRLHSFNQFETNKDNYEKSMNYTNEDDNTPLDDMARNCDGILCKGRKRASCFFYIRKKNNKPYGMCKKCMFYDNKMKRKVNKDYIDKIKLNIGKCEICNIETIKDTLCCFDFDHLDRNIKTTCISNYAKTNSDKIKEIDIEIKKCRLICCKCHKLHTANQMNYSSMEVKPTPLIHNTKIICVDCGNDVSEKLKKCGRCSPKIKQTLAYSSEIICVDCGNNVPKKLKKCKSCYTLYKNIIKPKLPPNKCKCGSIIDRKAQHCVGCYNLNRRKVKRPPYDILKQEILETNYVQVGKKYGVSDNAIRKWIKTYEK